MLPMARTVATANLSAPWHRNRDPVILSQGCHKRSAAKGVRSLFSVLVAFRSFFRRFCRFFRQTPFAGLLLPDSFCDRIVWENLNGGSQTGLKPQIFLRKSGGNPSWEIGWGKLGPFQGLRGPLRDQDQFLCTAQPRGKSGPFLAQLAPFGPSPRLLSPAFGFPRMVLGIASKMEKGVSASRLKSLPWSTKLLRE